MIKKILHIIIFLFTAAAVNAQDAPVAKNIISDFSARIKKDNVNLYWQLINPENIKTVTLEYRRAGTDEYKEMETIPFESYDKTDIKDSVTFVTYSYKTKFTENGVYYLKLTLLDNNDNEITFTEIKAGVSGITEFKLHQNNPNPFNPATSISYELLTASQVSLKVYNMSGKTVAVLADGYQTPGNYSFEFNAGNYGELPSGIYFYKLTTQYSSDIKKMILAK